MILPKLVAVLKRLVGVQSSIESRLDTIEKSIERLLKTLDVPTGEIKVRGVINTSTEQLRVAMQDKGQFELEQIQIDVQFSQAIYLAASKKNQEKIKKLVESKQVDYLKTVLENHKELNEMAEWATNFMNTANEDLRNRAFDIQKNIERNLTVGENSAVAKMNVSATKLKAQNAKIDKAMETLHLKIEEVTKLGFQLRGAVADHVPQESQIFRPKRKS